MRNNRCDMCDGSGEGSGGYKGICGYCDGTGEGVCQECQYPSSAPSPAPCGTHGTTAEGREHARALRAERKNW